MKSLLTAILCLAAVATTRAAETPSKFAGRWAGISEYGRSTNPDQINSRTLLTIEVDPQGYITNGAIRDFAGNPYASFFGQLDAHGRITTDALPVQGTIIGQIKLDLGRDTGSGIHRVIIPEIKSYRAPFRLWREQKPTRNSEVSISSHFYSLSPIGSMPTNIIVLPIPAAPAAPNP